MKLLHNNEHLSCIHYDHSGNPGIEVKKIIRGEQGELSVTANEVVFVIRGRVKLHFPDLPACKGTKGQMLFIPTGRHYAYEALEDTLLVIFRLTQPITLCGDYSIDKLYGAGDIKPWSGRELPAGKKKIGTLEINFRLWNLLDWIMDCIADGIKCRCWFEVKHKEFFLLLRAYYSKEKLHDFFYLILNRDIAFSEYVLLYWQRMRSAKDMAASLNMTEKQFTRRFVSVFGQTPHRWMTERKAALVYDDITITNELFKNIAIDRGFNTDTQFTRFCRKQFGKTPTELRESTLKREW